MRLLKPFIPGRYRLLAIETYFRVRSLLYKGDLVSCPCCEGHFRKFLPGGVVTRPGAECPRCGSLERHRLLWLYAKDRTNIFSDNLKVLHLAPEHIFQKAFTSLSNLDYISADLDSPLAMVKMDISNLPYEDGFFDVVLCVHVLEHVIDDRKAMRELFRVLKPGGWAILQSPVDHGRDRTFEDITIVLPDDRERAFGQADHIRIYGLDYKDRLEEAGFAVEVDSYVRDLEADIIKKYGLLEGINIYFCTKPTTRGLKS